MSTTITSLLKEKEKVGRWKKEGANIEKNMYKKERLTTSICHKFASIIERNFISQKNQLSALVFLLGLRKHI